MSPADEGRLPTNPGDGQRQATHAACVTRPRVDLDALLEDAWLQEVGGVELFNRDDPHTRQRLVERLHFVFEIEGG